MTTRMTDKLNAKETRVLSVFLRRGRPTPKTINDLAKECWGRGRGMTFERATSWVRNSLRRLVRLSVLEQVDTGTYQITELGRELAHKGLV